MAFQKGLFLIVLFLASFKLSAQELTLETTKDTSSVGQLAVYDAKQAVLGVKHAFTRPFHWKKKDFATLGAIGVGLFALSTIDDEGSAFLIRQEPDVPNVFMEAGTRFGSPQVYFIANAGLYGFGLLTKNEKIRKTSVLIISSSFTTGLIQSFSKTAFGRARPGNGYKSTEFRFWSNEPGFHSFPSGHTVLSMTMAHSIAKQFDNIWSKVTVYTLGSVAPISRLFAGAHWFTDVALGAIISIAVVDSVDKFLFNTKAYDYPVKKKNRISWKLNFSGNKIGVVGVF
ncbi:phosphatase PAP2 family protein [Flavivirga amylovorans]|uniref:Phosphatase PAP2 family protein n=1 Tax=Flavivirga amylovorans TaxID=870486 RepID=A0ABT8X123_9FLAO|nr:phosphatase PAP2 family protein [Flavivirga amylovorans]MDO5987649.1 phosphatase PAP2 family protein [Flavivirga amylovorans]